MPALMNGRAGREQYWRLLGVILLGLGLSLAWQAWFSGLSLLACWALVAGLRLHDLGRGGWWASALLGFLAGLVGAASLVGPLMMTPAAVLASVILAICAIWLGLLDGEPGDNRFGPPPLAELRPIGLPA